MKRGKKYQAIKNTKEAMSVEDAAKTAKSNSITKFESKIDLHVALIPKDKKAETEAAVRVNITLPHSLGKESRVVVFTDDAAVAKKAGAIDAGNTELIKKIEDGWVDFDVAIATPAMMPQIAKLGRVLGTRGLMPNPKMGTVTEDIEKTVGEFKSGKVAAKADAFGVVHITVGTTKMEDAQIAANTQAALDSILEQTGRPNAQQTFKSIYLAPTMGPSVRVNL